MSQIVINLEDCSFEQVKRIRKIVEILFDQKLFDIRNGKAVLHFDTDGVLRVMDWETTKWRKEKLTLPVLMSTYKKFKIDMSQ